MLSILDRRLKAWHFWLANAVAVAWFLGMNYATQVAMPGMRLFRCPIGLCLGYYSPAELNAMLTKVGKSGREFLADSLLPFDMVLPALLLMALSITYVWFTRPGREFAVPVTPATRYTFLCLPLLYCLADYAENWTLAEALQTYPNIPYRLARRASILTAAKSQLIVAAVGVAVALAIAAWGLAHHWHNGSSGARR
jgi:hypothetical protein